MKKQQQQQQQFSRLVLVSAFSCQSKSPIWLLLMNEKLIKFDVYDWI